MYVIRTCVRLCVCTHTVRISCAVAGECDPHWTVHSKPALTPATVAASAAAAASAESLDVRM